MNMNNTMYRNDIKNRSRKTIWFNSLFFKLSNINVDKYFLGLIDKHFKKDNSLSNIIAIM